jgi:hypothetical protein
LVAAQQRLRFAPPEAIYTLELTSNVFLVLSLICSTPIAMPETIHRVNGYAKDAYTYIPVVIVGAGESAIAMACQLKQQLGFDQFRLFDRQAGIGGTWWINRYPGVACDV